MGDRNFPDRQVLKSPMKLLIAALMTVIGSQGITPLPGANINAPPKPTQQPVLIEAVILEFTPTGSEDLRLDPNKWPEALKDALGVRRSKGATGIPATRFNFGETTNTSSNQPSGLGFVLRQRDDFGALVKTLGRDSRVRILQRPRIQTFHAVPATMFVGESRHYPQDLGVGEAGNISSIAPVQVGTTLEVTPFVKSTGSLVLDVLLQIDRLEGNVTIANVGQVPVTSSKTAQLKLELGDGDTAIFGGLTECHRKQSPSALRFPKDLPTPSGLASDSPSRVQRSELLVCVRPTLLVEKTATVSSMASSGGAQEVAR